MNFIVCIFLAVQPRLLLGSEDYWDDNFDEGKNCEAEEEIIKLTRLPKPGRCAVARLGKNQSWPSHLKFENASDGS